MSRTWQRRRDSGHRRLPARVHPLRLLSWLPVVLAVLAGGARAEQAEEKPAWDLGGDFRIRYEGNSASDNGSEQGQQGPERHRGVLRLRLAARYQVNELLTVGARLVTGDPDNPRTSDVTISDFVHDLEISLDQAFVALDRGRLRAAAGKLANPFLTTELVWDGDVNPTGVGGSLDLSRPGQALSARLNGIFMVVDEQPLADDSTMWGAQLVLEHRWTGQTAASLALAYWDYRITSLDHADDAGDLRGNYTTPDGTALLSDFNLADLTLTLSLPGPSAALPVRVVADLVTNLGAVVDEDQGYGLDVFLGSARDVGQLELRYGFARCETDAVLGTFSHDNLPLATGYQNHSLRIAYGLLEQTSLSLTWYRFSRLQADARYPGERPGEARSRIRLDLMLRF